MEIIGNFCPNLKCHYNIARGNTNTNPVIHCRCSIVDRLRRWHWSRVDWILELGVGWQPPVDHAVWRENSIWTQRELCLWDARFDVRLSGDHLSNGNDIFEVGMQHMIITQSKKVIYLNYVWIDDDLCMI